MTFNLKEINVSLLLIWRDKKEVFELNERSRLTLWRLSGLAPTQTQVQPQISKMMNSRISRIVFSLLIFVNMANGGMYRRRYRARQRNQRSFSKNSTLPQPIAVSGVIRGHKCKFKFHKNITKYVSNPTQTIALAKSRQSLNLFIKDPST